MAFAFRALFSLRIWHQHNGSILRSISLPCPFNLLTYALYYTKRISKWRKTTSIRLQTKLTSRLYARQKRRFYSYFTDKMMSFFINFRHFLFSVWIYVCVCVYVIHWAMFVPPHMRAIDMRTQCMCSQQGWWKQKATTKPNGSR